MAVGVSPGGHRYDRNIPAPLPKHRMLEKAPVGLNPVVDLRSSCGPVKDQGSEGSCTAHAGSSNGEWTNRKYMTTWGTQQFSPQFTYENELIRMGVFPQDNGSDGTTLCESLIGDGLCPLGDDPYVAGQIVQPTPAQVTAAKQYTFGAYHGVTDSGTAWSVLADPTPWCIMIGFTVYQSFEATWEINGVMPLPATGEQVLGGHEVLIVGCDLGDTATLRPAGSPPSFLIQNSWGTGWALDGFFWMPRQILDAQDTDLKIAHTGHPWVAVH